MSHRPKIGPAAGKKRPDLEQKVEKIYFRDEYKYWRCMQLPVWVELVQYKLNYMIIHNKSNLIIQIEI